MKADMGCDAAGERPCDEALEAAVTDDVLLAFPPGQYRFEQEHRFERVDNFSIVGTGREHRDVEFVFPSGYSGIFLGLWYGEDWLLQNFTVQQSMDRRTGVGLEIVTHDGFEMSDVEIAGFSPYNKDGGKRGLYCDVLSAEGTAVIERYVYKDPSAVGDYSQGTQAFLADESHRGTLYCRDWRIENAGENGIYASRTPGDVRVEGGFFRNNDISSIRVCGEGSYIRDATIVIDTANASSDNVGTYDNTRGIWWESGLHGKSGGYIENCELVMRSTTVSEGLLRINWTAGSVAVRNCRLRNETPWATLSAIRPHSQLRRGRVGVSVENVSIVALGEGRPALDIRGRPGTVVRGASVTSPHGSRDGLYLEDTPRTSIDDAVVHAGRYPVFLDSDGPVDRCQVSLSEQVALRSTRFHGQVLFPSDEYLAATRGRPTYCVPVEFGVPYASLALTASSKEGLHGHLLAADGRILLGDDKTPPQPDA